MSWPSPYLLPAFAATALCAAFGVVGWRRRGEPGMGAFLLLILSAGIWAGVQVLDAVVDGRGPKTAVAGLQYIGIGGSPLSYLAFVLSHCLGIEIWRHRKVLGALLVIPTVSVLLAFTSPWHTLLWEDLVSEPGLPIRAVRYGPWFAVHATYLYALTAIGVGVVLAQAIRSPSSAVRLAPIWFAPLAIMIANGLWLARVIVMPLDPTPIGFAVGVVATGIAVFRLGLLDATPLSRAALLEDMGDLVIAVDARGRIADVNRTAAELLSCPQAKALGMPACDVLPAQVCELACQPPAEPVELSLAIVREERIFEARGSRLEGGRGGTLLVLREVTPRKLAERELARTREQLEAANAELTRLASTDALTGVASRREFLARLDAEIMRSSRSGAPLALVLVDVDHFKRVNDEYGHPTGDRVLAAIGQSLLDGRRAGDLPGRLGGEEFALLLCGTEFDGCMVVAERLRARIAELAFETPDGVLHVTASLGIAMLSAERLDAGALIAAADAALYAAKHAGRDCIQVAGSD